MVVKNTVRTCESPSWKLDIAVLENKYKDWLFLFIIY